MELRQYLSDERIAIPTFARSISVSVQAVHRYLAGHRIPQADVMERIVCATSGRVQPNDFYASKRNGEAA